MIKKLSLFSAAAAMLISVSAPAQAQGGIVERFSGTSEDAIRAELEQMGYEIVEFETDDDEYEVKVTREGRRYEIEIERDSGLVKEFEQD